MRKLLSFLMLSSALTFVVGSGVTRAQIDPCPDRICDSSDDATTIPEPTAALVMGVGLATIAVALRRRS